MKWIRRFSIITIAVVVIVTLTQDASIVRTVTTFLPLDDIQIQRDNLTISSALLSNLQPTRWITTNSNNNDTTNHSESKDGNIEERIQQSGKNATLESRNDSFIVTTPDVDVGDRDDNQQNNNNATTTTTSSSKDRPTTIVVKLSGEMGNSLSKFATARGLQLWAKDKYNMDTTFVVRHQDASKWVGAKNNVKRCFPKLRHYDFEQGNTPEYNEIKREQRKWLGNESALLMIETVNDASDIDESLSYLQTVLTWKNSSMHYHGAAGSENFTLPYIKADYLAMVDFWIDKYYDEYRTYFKFDRRKCCKLKPDPDESVFHFRNFLVEMPRRGKRLGFEELSPNQTAYQLFRNLHAGDKVAITSRFITDPSIKPYIDAFAERGIQARVIDNQSPVEDFCFLMNAKKELVGMAESSFVLWAGYLGNPDKVRLYSINSAARRSSLFSERVFKYYNWTNPTLQAKVFFELYNAEDDTKSV